MSIKIVNESVQMIHVGPSTPLTLTQIQYALQKAASNRMYAKFYTDKYFIQVNFMKDYTINLSSNINIQQFVNDFRKKERQGWTIPLAKQFIYQWMTLCRRQLK